MYSPRLIFAPLEIMFFRVCSLKCHVEMALKLSVSLTISTVFLLSTRAVILKKEETISLTMRSSQHGFVKNKSPPCCQVGT